MSNMTPALRQQIANLGLRIEEGRRLIAEAKARGDLDRADRLQLALDEYATKREALLEEAYGPRP